MKASIYRIAGGWAVKTHSQELICASIHDAMDIAIRHSQAAGDARVDFRGK